MKIRLKLTLISTAVTALILVGVSLSIYYFFSLYRQIEFYDRLKERAVITEQYYMEEDELSTLTYQEVQKKYQQYLPDEVTALFGMEADLNRLQDSLQVRLPPDFFEQIAALQYMEFKSGDRQAVAVWYDDNQGDFVVCVSAIDHFGIIKMADLQTILIACFFISIGIIFISGKFFSQQALKPITKMVKDVNRIGLSNLHLRVVTDDSKDEINELAMTFNHMLERLETSFERQKNFISNASHELKNPLTAIIGQVALMLEKERPAEEYRDALQTVAYEAKRLNNLTSKLLSLAQTDFDESTLLDEEVRLDELLMEVEEDVSKVFPGNRIQIHFENIPEEDALITLTGNRKLLQAALANILENACKFSGNQEVCVSIRADETELMITIADRGIGIAPQDLQNIFQPFYRAGNARGYQGFGIGLSLTDKIIRMHGGAIQVASELDAGTRFMITFEKHREIPKLKS